MRCALALVVLCLAAAAQNNDQRPMGSRFSELRPPQQALVADLVARLGKQMGKPIEAANAYDSAPQSIRTTFDAVTHALVTTKLTGEDGKELGTALDIVAAIDEVAGERRGESGDRQFRVYFFLKPNAKELLDLSREFRRSHDNTVFHHGYPICYRMRGTPSVQFSLSADGDRADVDVDYLSSRFPVGLVNGHLSASNSDVRAGSNDRRHNDRWNGLVAWWTQLFSWRGAVERPADADLDDVRPGGAYGGTPRVRKGKIENAVTDFYRAWLVDRDVTQAVPYFSREVYGCAAIDAEQSKVSVEQGMARIYLAQQLKLYLDIHPERAKLPAMMSPAPTWSESLKTIEHPMANAYLLAKVDAAFADAHDCSQLAGEGESSQKRKGDFFVSASIFKRRNGEPVEIFFLWQKEGVYWKIIAFDTLEHGEGTIFTKKALPQHAPVIITQVDGDKGLIKTIEKFLETWLEDKRPEEALEYFSPESFACAADESVPAARRSSNVLRRDTLNGLRHIARYPHKGDIEDILEAPVLKNGNVRVVRHEDADDYIILSVPDQRAQILRCGNPLSNAELNRSLAEAPVYGNLYVLAFQFEQVDHEPAVLFTGWRKTDAGWRIFWWEVETP